LTVAPGRDGLVNEGARREGRGAKSEIPAVPSDESGQRDVLCELMKHGLGVDILACPCGHRMKYVATIFDKKGLARLLRAKGLPHQLEPIRPARGPPQQDFDFAP